MNKNNEVLISFLNEVEDYYEEVLRGINTIKSKQFLKRRD